MSKVVPVIIAASVAFVIGCMFTYSSRPALQPGIAQQGLQSLPIHLGQTLKEHAETIGQAKYVGLSPEGDLVIVLGKNEPPKMAPPTQPAKVEPAYTPPKRRKAPSYLTQALRAITPSGTR